MGDSHSGAISRGIVRAVQGQMSFVMAGRAATSFSGVYAQEQDSLRKAWVNRVVRALKEHVQEGDVLAIMNIAGKRRSGSWDLKHPTWLLTELYAPIIQAKKASLLLLGDNPALGAHPTQCRHNPHLCAPRASDGLIASMEEFDNLATEFAASRPDVFFFKQSDLWVQTPAGEQFTGQVPGTTTNAYNDQTHSLSVGALYLWPYICSALTQWGFFDTSLAG